jgi:hypothetical protein
MGKIVKQLIEDAYAHVSAHADTERSDEPLALTRIHTQTQTPLIDEAQTHADTRR